MFKELRLHHELLLLALHDRKGTHAFGKLIEIGLGGALFTELLFEERIRLAATGRRGRDLVEVAGASADSARVAHGAHSRSARGGHGARDHQRPLLDEAVERLAGKRRKSPKTAVSSLARLPKLRHRIARELCRMGMLRESEDRILLLFRRRIYPTVDPGPERTLVARVRDVLEERAEPDERTTALVMIADATDVLRALASKQELKAYRARIDALRSAGQGSATYEAVKAAEAAAAAASG
jgi:hypothetical protein